MCVDADVVKVSIYSAPPTATLRLQQTLKYSQENSRHLRSQNTQESQIHPTSEMGGADRAGMNKPLLSA